MEKYSTKKVYGSLIGGAIGDALGRTIEFMKYKEIIEKYGTDGITDLDLVDGKGEITDDTQMTLFTAEGILSGIYKEKTTGDKDMALSVYISYLKWLTTQGEEIPEGAAKYVKHLQKGWLYSVKDLQKRQAPGDTCLGSLKSGTFGSIDKPINNSKGCGGVMRMAPVGMLPGLSDDETFKMGCDFAALTHCRPSGYLSAGAFALMIRYIMDGKTLTQGVDAALAQLPKYKGHEEVLSAITSAVALSKDGEPTVEKLESLGEAWVGDEALAVSLYCALCYEDDYKAAVLFAVNHSGDCDSTAAITGNMLGAKFGIDAIPKDWIDKMELTDEIYKLSQDIVAQYEDTKEWAEKYAI